MSITIEQIVSVDGFAADSDGGMDFFGRAAFDGDNRTDQEQLEFLNEIDRIVLGRTTFELFNAYWPTADVTTEAVAEPINRLPKSMLTTTLDAATWGDGAGEVELLRSIDGIVARSTAGERLVVWGSLSVCRALLAAGVVDRLRLRIVPTLLGAGLGYTADVGTSPMRLVGVESHPSGHATLDYRLERD